MGASYYIIAIFEAMAHIAVAPTSVPHDVAMLDDESPAAQRFHRHRCGRHMCRPYIVAMRSDDSQ